jgi:uncharacterized protein YbjT (DUF2867 family)
MSSKKVFVVIGATGAQVLPNAQLTFPTPLTYHSQGGAVAQYFLKNLPSDLTIRAITRNPSSASATALKDLGAEVVKADLNDKPSLERAFKNATYIFSVTNYFDTLDAAAEITQGVNVIDAACTTALHTLQSFVCTPYNPR